MAFLDKGYSDAPATNSVLFLHVRILHFALAAECGVPVPFAAIYSYLSAGDDNDILDILIPAKIKLGVNLPPPSPFLSPLRAGIVASSSISVRSRLPSGKTAGAGIRGVPSNFPRFSVSRRFGGFAMANCYYFPLPAARVLVSRVFFRRNERDLNSIKMEELIGGWGNAMASRAGGVLRSFRTENTIKRDEN